MTARRQARWSTGVALAAAAAFAVLTLGLALARVATVHNRTFDLALYTRQAWGLAHGQLWEPIVGGDFFGGHLAWVLAPLGALGALFGTVQVLLLAQSLALAAAAWPLYRLGSERLGAFGGAAAALAWLLYPNLGHVATYEFHPGNLAVLPLMVACCALERAERDRSVRARTFVLASLAALACRVSLALELCTLGLLAAYRVPRFRQVALLLAGGCAAYFLLWLLWLQPQHGAGASAELHFGKWGGSAFGVLRALVQEPGLVLEHLLAPARRDYALRVLGPLALLPLLAPRWLWPALPIVALNLLSEFPTSVELYSHYLTPALPPLAVGAVAGAAALQAGLQRARLASRLPQLNQLPALALLIAALGGYVLAGGLPGARDYDARAFVPDASTIAALEVLAAIPAGASVQAPDRMLPRLAERVALFRAPPPERRADWVVLDVSHRRRFAQREDLLRTIEEPIVRGWLARGDHQLVLASGELLLLRRGWPARAGVARRYFLGFAPAQSGVALTACLALRAAELHARSVTLELVARGPCASDLAIRLGSTPKPERVDLLFDGLLSPAQLGSGDLLRSRHALSRDERAAIVRHGLRVGALRASGARPAPGDPISVEAPLRARGEP